MDHNLLFLEGLWQTSFWLTNYIDVLIRNIDE